MDIILTAKRIPDGTTITVRATKDWASYSYVRSMAEQKLRMDGNRYRIVNVKATHTNAERDHGHFDRMSAEIRDFYDILLSVSEEVIPGLHDGAWEFFPITDWDILWDTLKRYAMTHGIYLKGDYHPNPVSSPAYWSGAYLKKHDETIAYISFRGTDI